MGTFGAYRTSNAWHYCTVQKGAVLSQTCITLASKLQAKRRIVSDKTSGMRDCSLSLHTGSVRRGLVFPVLVRAVRGCILSGCAIALPGFWATAVGAETPPPRPSLQMTFVPSPIAERLAPSEPPPPSAADATPIPVRQIVIQGSTVFPQAELDALAAPLVGKSVTLAQLRDLAERITQRYLDRNYITSRALLPAGQDVTQGIVTIQILEGELERIEVKRLGDEGGRLSENYVRDRVALGVTTPLNFARLEEELQLLRADPLIADIRANLSAGTKPNGSVLQITFAEAKSLSINPFIDNYGNPATGIYRAGATVEERNLTGSGDRLTTNYTRSGSADAYTLAYQVPVNPRGGTVGLSFAKNTNPVSETAFQSLNIYTDSQVLELAFRQPLARTPRHEFALSLALALEQGNSFLDGEPFNFQTFEFDDGRSQSTVVRFGQDYIGRDPGGAWVLQSTFNLGISAFGATIRPVAPDGTFFYWNGQILRVQRLGEDRDTLALFRVGAQIAGEPLLPLNRYSVGGPQSVRGYRQDRVTGDSGIQGSIELQLPVVRDPDGVSLVKLLPFLDAGTVWNASGSTPDPQTLVGVGLGVLWQPTKNVNLRLDYGIPLVKANDPGNTLQDAGVYFSLSANL